MNNKNFSNNTDMTFGSDLFSDNAIANMQTMSLPALTFTHPEIQHGGVSSFLQGESLIYGELDVEFILDDNMTVWKDIVNTMFKARDQNGEVEEDPKNAWVSIKKHDGSEVLKLEFSNVRIENIGEVIYDTRAGNEINTLSVLLKYDSFDIV